MHGTWSCGSLLRPSRPHNSRPQAGVMPVESTIAICDDFLNENEPGAASPMFFLHRARLPVSTWPLRPPLETLVPSVQRAVNCGGLFRASNRNLFAPGIGPPLACG